MWGAGEGGGKRRPGGGGEGVLGEYVATVEQKV